jgi:hypothetical protein
MLCSYGCGNEGIFKLKNGKYSCCKSANSCPAKKVAIADKAIRENPGLCDFGCGQNARYYFKTVKKWCCEKHHRSCPAEALKFGKLKND